MKTFLIASTSFNLINNELDKIKKDYSNIVKYDLRTDSLDSIFEEASYYTIGNDKKLIIVKGDSLFNSKKSDDDKTIEKLIEKIINVNDDKTVICFTTLVLPDKRKKIYKLLSDNVIYIDTLNKKDLINKCGEILKNSGYKTNYDSLSFIVDNSYVNFDIMLSEIDKIKAIIPKGTIDIDILKNVISTSLNSKIYDYIDAIFNRNLSVALRELKNFEILKIDPIPVLITLYKEVSNLYEVKNSNNVGELQRKLGKQDWQMDVYYKNKDNYSNKELEDMILLFNDYDYKLKSGKLDKDVCLSLLTLQLCK